MSFKYLNPGFPGLLDTTSGVLVEDEKCSRTGVGFWQPNTEKGVKFPTYPQELYCKFDFFLYYDTSSNTDYSIIVRFLSKSQRRMLTSNTMCAVMITRLPMGMKQRSCRMKGTCGSIR